MSLIQNERTKLTATWLNGIGIASVAVGGIAPSVAYVVGTAALGAVLISGVIWISIGFGLHLGGRLMLGRLRP